MSIIFCDSKGIILNHMVAPKTTVTGQYYATLLKSELYKTVKRKRPELIQSGFILHHDNAPSHTSRIVQDTIEKLGIELLPHPPYSPDLAICDFWLFPVLKKNLRGDKYESHEGPTGSRGTRHCGRCHATDCSTWFQAWVARWEKCKLSEGRYFEKE